MKKTSQFRFIVGNETKRMLSLGHPWVIADRYTAKWPRSKTGDLIELLSEANEPLGTALIDPSARIVARVLSPKLIKLDCSWLQKCLHNADQTRKWLNLSQSNAWRLVNAEGDGLPGLCVDRYGDYLLVQYYTLAWEPHLAKIIQALNDHYQPLGIYAKFRPPQTRNQVVLKKVKAQLKIGQPIPNQYNIIENDLSFIVELTNDLHTGLFFDQRDNRLMLKKMAGGQRVLNLFAYTGAFSVAAASGGATQVTSVDIAARYLDWAKENFWSNGIDPSAHEFIVGDCFAVVKNMKKEGRMFDTVLIDPPSFSTTHKSRFRTSGGTAELVKEALGLLPSGGMLMTSSNLQKMSLSDYLKELRRASIESKRSLKVINISSQSGDFPYAPTFPEGQYLKFVTSIVQDEF
ncbi:MAG: class I SAM-dependent rRNA methyltransferase [Deltaproteobacteria bacterium]|jgi:23S rRNA (cytosine1962-C5)-methyltransferase|nr:class I SAM-dependent rRNA methyltransferase [Deltaproteobacteria bacterium]